MYFEPAVFKKTHDMVWKVIKSHSMTISGFLGWPAAPAAFSSWLFQFLQKKVNNANSKSAFSFLCTLFKKRVPQGFVLAKKMFIYRTIHTGVEIVEKPFWCYIEPLKRFHILSTASDLKSPSTLQVHLTTVGGIYFITTILILNSKC